MFFRYQVSLSEPLDKEPITNGQPHAPSQARPLDKSTPQRIASVVSCIDTAIEKTEALIAKHQQIKAGLMHDLCTRGVLPNGQLRPPRSEAPELYQEMAMGWIPKEWRSQRLGAMLDESGGYVQSGPFGSQWHASEQSEEGVPVVMPQDINDGLIDEVAMARIPAAPEPAEAAA